MSALTHASAAPQWSLDDLFTGPDDPRIAQTLDAAKADAEAFATRYRGKVAGLSPADLCEAIAAAEALMQSATKPAAFASLRFAADTRPENGALVQSVREQTTSATLPLLFFDVELTALGAPRLRELAADPALARYRHYLETVAARAAFRLTEAEERVLEEKNNTGARSWVRLYEEITSSLRFSVPGHDAPLTLSQTLDLQYSVDRETRRQSAEAVAAGLEPYARNLAFIFNTLLQDKATEDRLRGQTYQEQARDLANELTPETVETVVQTATDGYGLVARYYAAKQKLLGLDTLYHYDRYAPVVADGEPSIGWETARETVLTAFRAFDPTYAHAAQEFFDQNWIDAAPRENKRGGAFCSYITPDLHPYIFLNYLDKAGDVRTLAHELGHGIHSYVSREQSYLNFHGTLPMAEVASTFAEMLVFDELIKDATPAEKLTAYAHQIEQAIATIFRQAALYRFEQSIHAQRRTGQELTVARFGELWQENTGAMFAGSVTLLPGHALWWTYVRHFIATPFYVYAYTFGEMLALALYQRYRETGQAFVAPYLTLLRAGGSLSPAELVAPLGVDLESPAFWQGALDILAQQVEAFETLAREVSAAR